MQIIANDVAGIAATIELIEKQIHGLVGLTASMYIFVVVFLFCLILVTIKRH